MKIGILGAGAMGILFGGSLNKAGYDVKLIMRDRSKIGIINKEGIKINLDNGSYRVYPKAITPDGINNFDLILVFTKTNDTINALESIKKFISKNTYLMSLQNGLGNFEKLLIYVKKSKIIYGTSMAPADLIGITEVTSLGSHISQFKSGDLNNNIFVEDVALALNNAGLKSIINNKVDEVIWAKVAFNTAMNSICALLEVTPKAIHQNLNLKSFALSVASETCIVAEKAGYKINKQEVIDNIELSCKEHGEHKPSMLQDILLKKKTEIDSLNGEVARIGLSYNVKTPLNNALFNMIKAKESGY